jgi:cytochrome c oxidase subunit I
VAIATEASRAEPTGDQPRDRLLQTWTDPGGFHGWLITVQNGPISNRYIFTAFAFFLAGGIEALLMRTQLARPESDFISPQLFNGLFTMHGSTMMFLFAVPIMEAFANLLLPMLLGTRELPFPRMTAFGYWTYLFGGLFFYTSFLFAAVPDGGWFAYVPLTGPTYSPGLAIDIWLLGLSVAEVAAMGAGIELTVAILKMRAPGMSISRIPLYCWAILVTGFMMLFGFTPLLVSTTLLELDRLFHTQFFVPAGGGDPLLWQHLFWIFGHPDVYIMFIPATGIISAVVATFARRPVAGYTLVVLAIVATGIISFGLWVHHVFAAGLPALGMSFFTAASLSIGIASGIQVFAWIATIWSGRPIWTTAFLFALGFIVTFVIGGVTGIMVAAVPFDWQAHDSYFVVAHFHYVLVGGVVFPIFAALYYWMPAMAARKLDERLGQWNFWLMFVGFNVAFFPMHLTGLLGMPRRVYTYEPGLGWDLLNLVSSLGTYVLGLGVLLFVVNVVWSLFLRRGEEATDRPWGSGLLDEAQPLPAPDEGWRTIPIVHTRYPLWQQERLDRGDDRTVQLVQALARARHLARHVRHLAGGRRAAGHRAPGDPLLVADDRRVLPDRGLRRHPLPLARPDHLVARPDHLEFRRVRGGRRHLVVAGQGGARVPAGRRFPDPARPAGLPQRQPLARLVDHGAHAPRLRRLPGAARLRLLLSRFARDDLAAAGLRSARAPAARHQQRAAPGERRTHVLGRRGHPARGPGAPGAGPGGQLRPRHRLRADPVPRLLAARVQRAEPRLRLALLHAHRLPATAGAGRPRDERGRPALGLAGLLQSLAPPGRAERRALLVLHRRRLARRGRGRVPVAAPDVEATEGRPMASSRPATHAGSRWVLWLCLFAGPAAWTAHLLLSYPLVPWVCASGLPILLHLITLLTALVTLAAAVIAFRGWDQATQDTRPDDERAAATGYLALTGVLMDGLFLFVIVVEGLPSFLLGPCG